MAGMTPAAIAPPLLAAFSPGLVFTPAVVEGGRVLSSVVVGTGDMLVVICEPVEIGVADVPSDGHWNPASSPGFMIVKFVSYKLLEHEQLKPDGHTTSGSEQK